MNNPLVSVVVPVYSGSKYIKQSFDLICAQTYKNLKIVFVNDGSADDTTAM